MLQEEKSEVELKTSSRFKTAGCFFLVSVVILGFAHFMWKMQPLQAGIFTFVFGLFSFMAGSIGLITFIASISVFLSAFNPTVKINLSPDMVPLGSSAVVRWELQGRIERLRKLTINLECRKEERIETARRSNRRTDSNTKTTVLYFEELISITRQNDMPRGQVGFVIDQNKRSTFKGDVESIRWFIVVKGNINWWPDINDEFAFSVLS